MSLGQFTSKGAQDTGERFVQQVFSKMHIMTIIPFSYIFKVGSSGLPQGFLGDAEFLGKVMAANMIPSVVQSFGNMGYYIEALAAEALFIMGQFWYYKFLLNPSNVKIGHQKLQTISEASDITIINTFRNQSPTMSISGVSGCLLPRALMSAAGTEKSMINEMAWAKYPKVSPAWLKFRQLEKFYNEINSDIVMMYDMDLFVGKFVSFEYSQDANNPYVITYSMNFRLYPGLMLHTLSAYDYKPFFDTMLQRYGNSFAKTFEGKAI